MFLVPRSEKQLHCVCVQLLVRFFNISCRFGCQKGVWGKRFSGFTLILCCETSLVRELLGKWFWTWELNNSGLCCKSVFFVFVRKNGLREIGVKEWSVPKARTGLVCSYLIIYERVCVYIYCEILWFFFWLLFGKSSYFTSVWFMFLQAKESRLAQTRRKKKRGLKFWYWKMIHFPSHEGEELCKF